MKPLLSMLAIAAAAVLAGTLAPGSRQAVAAATAPPAPPTPASVAPTVPPLGPGAPPSSVNVPLKKPAPDQSAPPDDNRKGLDGVWEVAIQSPTDETRYVHFKLTQKGSTLTGTYLDNLHNNKLYPVAGSIDAKDFHLVVTKDDGTTISFEARVDGTTDMVGMMKEGSTQVAFTAAYRPKYKFIDNISPGIPGGLSGGTGSPP